MADLTQIKTWLVGQSADFITLAKAAALAARIEAGLVRSLRWHLLPQTDAGMEADFWFSPLVQSRSASGIVLHPEARTMLREELATKLDQLEAAWQIIERAHAGGPPSLRLEEEVTYLALRGADRGSLEAKLQPALYSLLQEQRRGLGQWAARALPLLPEAARQTEAAWLLALAASRETGGPAILTEQTPAGVTPEKIRAIVAEAQTTFIGIRLLEDGVEFGPPDLPGAKLIRVPQVSPVTLQISPAEPPQGIGQTVEFAFSLGERKVFSLSAQMRNPHPSEEAKSFTLNAPASFADSPRPDGIQVTTMLGETHSLRPSAQDARLSPAALRLRQRLTARSPKRILILSGVAGRMIAALGFLQHIEMLLARRFKRKDFRLADYFDLIGGVSSGGIIAAGLARGMTVNELRVQWLELIENALRRRSLLPSLIGYRYQDTEITKALAELFGNSSLTDDAFKTGFCLLLRRLETSGTWSLSNHPQSRFYAEHRNVLLRDVLRASLAGPATFRPVELILGDGQRGAYADAALGNMANAAWQLFRMATSQRFPFQWTPGADQLLVVAIGTGAWKERRSAEEIANAGLLQWAGGLPSLLSRNGRRQNEEWLESFAHSLTSPQSSAAGLFADNPRLSLVRYDFSLESPSLNELGLSDLASRVEALRADDAFTEAANLDRVAQAAAARDVSPEHFPPGFDPDDTSATSHQENLE